MDHVGQNGYLLLIKWDIWSSWTKKMTLQLKMANGFILSETFDTQIG
jgi:hypothetical protein